MLPRLLSLRAARFGRFPSGGGIRHWCASSSRRQEWVISSGIGGMSRFPHADSVLGRIIELERKVASIKAQNKGIIRNETDTRQAQARLDGTHKYIMSFVAGTILLGIGGGIIKIYHYDASRDEQMRAYIRDVVGNLESRIGNLESRMDRMESKMERMESKMDEISAYLKAKQGWWW